MRACPSRRLRCIDVSSSELRWNEPQSLSERSGNAVIWRLNSEASAKKRSVFLILDAEPSAAAVRGSCERHLSAQQVKTMWEADEVNDRQRVVWSSRSGVAVHQGRLNRRGTR